MFIKKALTEMLGTFSEPLITRWRPVPVEYEDVAASSLWAFTTGFTKKETAIATNIIAKVAFMI